MTAYTHRHKRTRKRCRIINESGYDGYTVYGVEVEGERGRYLWPRKEFLKRHKEIAEGKPDVPAPERMPLGHEGLGRCACGNPATKVMMLSTGNGAAEYRLCAECAELERQP